MVSTGNIRRLKFTESDYITCNNSYGSVRLSRLLRVSNTLPLLYTYYTDTDAIRTITADLLSAYYILVNQSVICQTFVSTASLYNNNRFVTIKRALFIYSLIDF